MPQSRLPLASTELFTQSAVCSDGAREKQLRD
eukprot:SAG31_NODE_33107_length_347_cov_4.584677_1_plen_31_part_10